MTAEIIQDDVLHALQDFERCGEKFDEFARKDFLDPKKTNKEESKEETPLFPSLENDDETH